MGLLDLNSSLLLARNSSPRPVYSSFMPGVPNPKASLECPTPERAWAAQSQSDSILECPWSAQSQSVPGVPSPRVSLECPSVPGVPNPRVSLECPTPEYLYRERVGMFEVKYLLGGGFQFQPLPGLACQKTAHYSEQPHIRSNYYSYESCYCCCYIVLIMYI